MKIELIKVKVRDLVKGYVDNQEEGVYCYGRRLNIRPPYQREFIYPLKDQLAVINTVSHSFPLNVMYWVDNNYGDYEILDGQQRTLSLCHYLNDSFSIDNMYFSNLPENKQRDILDYELTIYICKGEDEEKLKWFETINISGKTLTKQERRNAIYSGPWVTDAKRYREKRRKASAFRRGI